MEYIPGESLAAKLEKSPTGLAIADAVRYARDIADPLCAAHLRGIIHRDLKPHNVMIREDGKVFVMDFGLVRLEAEESISLSGVPMGTPVYMSPEQLADQKRIQAATDIYSLGVILYEMITGRTPFADNRSELFRKIIQEKPVPPSVHRPGIDPRLDAICLKAMAKLPKDRYASMDEMMTAIDQIGSPIPPSPAGLTTLLPPYRRWFRPPLPPPRGRPTSSPVGRLGRSRGLADWIERPWSV